MRVELFGVKNSITCLKPIFFFIQFSETSTGTKVEVEITFASKSDMEKIIELGFKEGFASAHTNLDELLAE